MDIINELHGHSGCVNALSWSRSGRLLASGSDDHHVNIHTYLPESSSAQFELATTIMTGHSRNIFSVKFMPYSNDRTIVSATDDVRIFDIEYAGRSTQSAYSTRAGRASAGLHGFPDGVRVLTEGDTNAKVFRSHSDTVKRIVTEDSPFFFLTCSEDGDVRQWDIRQPSSAYPAPRDAMLPRWANGSDSDNVPPPLISYKRYGLDLNTVSCSPSQPHYIALGGAHLHCFLHDRRMLGRDKLAERGSTVSSTGSWSDQENELLGQATQCVRKFAPNGQKRMRRNDNGHITACKISDANPNEIVVSWSGDWIYSFDLIRSPDATEASTESSKLVVGDTEHRVRDKVRKRKRPKSTSTVLREGLARGGSRPRTESSHGIRSDPNEELSLRVRWGNGQSEELRIEPADPAHSSSSEIATESDTEHFRIAKYTVKIRKHMFNLGSKRSIQVPSDPTGHSADFSSVLGFAAIALPEMDDSASSWRYPLNPNELDIALQNKLRDWRAASRRFVQAAGTLARVLGGKIHSGRNSDAILSRYFTSIMPAPNERPLPRHEQFGYDFLKAILLWLDSGVGAVVEGFSRSSGTSQSAMKPSSRSPLETDSSIDAIDENLIPYLLRLASDAPIVDVDVSRFEHDSTRILFSSEKDAVLRFAQALKLPFADLSSALVPASSSEGAEARSAVQDRREALLYWAFRVGRGVLLNAGKNVDFALVDRAFGGSGRPDLYISEIERSLRERQEDIDPLEEDDAVVDAELASRAWAEETSARNSSPIPSPDEIGVSQTSRDDGVPSAAEDGPEDEEDEDDDEVGEEVEEEEEDDEDDDDDGSDSDGDIDPEDDDEDQELEETRSGRVLWRSEFDRSRHRERVEANVPCAPHTRQYRGHCNVRTVKDVNFFGLQDEYVVSGSDCGNVFIWDRKTSQLLNILEGDGETVNVVQGHPYEPTMAISGIDHTIKIFSPDPHAQLNARKGIGVRPSDPSTFSSLRHRRRRPRTSNDDSEAAMPTAPNGDSESEGTDDVAPNGLSSRKKMHLEYQITSKNDVDRKGGNRDAFITRFLLAQLARRHAHPGMGDGDEEGGPIYVEDNEDCIVM